MLLLLLLCTCAGGAACSFLRLFQHCWFWGLLRRLGLLLLLPGTRAGARARSTRRLLLLLRGPLHGCISGWWCRHSSTKLLLHRGCAAACPHWGLRGCIVRAAGVDHIRDLGGTRALAPVAGAPPVRGGCRCC